MNKIKIGLEKTKRGLTKAALTASTAITATVLSVSSVAAKKDKDTGFDLAGGVKEATGAATAEFKPIIGYIAGAAAVIFFFVALFRTIHIFIEHRDNGEDIKWLPIIVWWLAVVISALASTSDFLGWFGL